jgi:hypothetical protein
MAIIQLLIVESLPSQRAENYAPYNTETICGCPPASYLEPAELLLQKTNLHIWKSPQRCVSSLQVTT